MEGMAMGTILDVARMAGVSPTTVSRVLNHKMVVDPETAKQVWAAVEALEYRPNAWARALITRQTGSIGIVVGNICDPFFPPVIQGITAVAHACGLSSFISNLSADPQTALYLRLVREKRVDGMIVATSKIPEEQIQMLHADGIPMVLVNRRMDDVPWVWTDYYSAGFMATRHLIELGHRRVAHITVSLDVRTGLERRTGYESALREAGLPVEPEWVAVDENSAEGGYRAASALLAAPDRPHAVFVYDDVMAIGAMCAFQSQGLHIPEQMSIIGCDDIALTGHMTPPLTTIRVDGERMGRLGMELLARLLRGEELAERRIVLEPQVVLRRSTSRAL
jgi:LacI family transcriptional regulator